MDNLLIQGEKNTFFIPTVEFNAETGVCALKGESYLEDTFTFYQQLEDWINNFAATGRPIIFDIGLSYFNTASSRSILDLLMALKRYQDNGGSVTVNWQLENWDDDMKQEVEDFAQDSELIINTSFN